MTPQGRPHEPGEGLTLAEVIEWAFDYRGNVTVVQVDGTEVEGYLFNRNNDTPAPFVEMFDLTGAGPVKIFCSDIRNIKLTGKDPAAGLSWTAWVERRKTEEAGRR